jgi:hypothetical protein
MTRAIVMVAVLAVAAPASAQRWVELGSGWGAITDATSGADGHTWAVCGAGLLRLDGETWTLAVPGGFGSGYPMAILATTGGLVVGTDTGALLRSDGTAPFTEIARVVDGHVRALLSPDGARVFVATDGAVDELVGTSLRPIRGSFGSRAMASSGPREALAAGETLTRFDGRTWRAVPGLEFALTSVTFAAPRHAWAVGRGSMEAPGGLVRWDGRRLEDVALPEEIAEPFAIVALGDTDLRLAASTGLFRGDGTTWQRIGSAAGIRGLRRVGERVLAFGDAGLIGWVGDVGVTPAVPIGPIGTITSVSGAGASSLQVVDTTGLSTWNGTNWSRMDLPTTCRPRWIARVVDHSLVIGPLCASRLEASGWVTEIVSAASARDVVVYRGQPWIVDVPMHRRGADGHWTDVGLPPDFDLMHAAASETRLVAIDLGRAHLVELAGTTWSPLPVPASVENIAMAGNALVATGSVVRVHEGTAWRDLPAYPSDGYGFDSVGGTSASDLWLVRYQGRELLHWDGAQWTVLPAPFRARTLFVLGSDIVLVGDGARIARLAR